MHRAAALLIGLACPALAAAQFTPVSRSRMVSYAWSFDTTPGEMGGNPTHMGGQDSRTASDFAPFVASVSGNLTSASQTSTIGDAMISGSGNATGAESRSTFGTTGQFSTSDGDSAFSFTFDVAQPVTLELTGSLHVQSVFDSAGDGASLSLAPDGGSWAAVSAFSGTSNVDVPVDYVGWLSAGRYTLSAAAHAGPATPTSGPQATVSTSYSFRLQVVPEPVIVPLLAILFPVLRKRRR